MLDHVGVDQPAVEYDAVPVVGIRNDLVGWNVEYGDPFTALRLAAPQVLDFSASSVELRMLAEHELW